MIAYDNNVDPPAPFLESMVANTLQKRFYVYLNGPGSQFDVSASPL